MWLVQCIPCALWLLVYLPTISNSQSLTPEQDSDLGDFIASLMQCRDNVGLTISLVRGGDVVFSEGFGHRDLEANATMENTTKINIGSLTKAFTATLAADVVGSGLADWETPLKDILGEGFGLEGEFRTQEVDMRDIFSHRLGMPNYWGLTTSAPNIARETLVMERLRYFTSRYDFRSHYLYSNYPYILAGYVTEVLTGSPWEEHIRELLFDQIGMSDTKHAAELTEADWDTDTAYSYIEEQGEYVQNPEQQQLPFIIEAAPSGGVFSTANDMAEWMLFHLNGGKNASGHQIVPSADLKELYASINARSGSNQIRRPTYPVEDTEYTYGMGFMSGTYRGREKITHTGSYSSYNCKMTLLPEVEVGVCACVNSPGDERGSTAVTLANIYALDLLLDEIPWLNETTACTFPQPWEPESKELHVLEGSCSRIAVDKTVSWVNQIHGRPTSNTNKQYPRRMEDFEGDYGHLGFGIFRVFLTESENLRYEFGLLLRGDLNPTEDEMTFAMTLDHPLTYRMSFYPQYPDGFPIYFYANEAGDIIQEVEVPYLEFSLPPIFERGVTPIG